MNRDDARRGHVEPTSDSFLQRAARFLGVAIFVSLLLVVVLVAIPYGTVDAWWEAIFECAIFALTSLWLLRVLLAGRWEIRGMFIVLPLALITAYAFAQTVAWPEWIAHAVGGLTEQLTLTIDRYQTYLTARKALALTLFLGLLLIHTSNLRRLRWLIRVIIGLGVASAIFAIMRQLLQSPTSLNGFVLPFLFYGIGYGQFIYHNAFAYLMEMTFAPLVGLVLAGGIPKDRILLYLAAIVPVWTALVLSESRGGILSLICQSIFLVFVALTWYSRNRLLRSQSESRVLTIIQSSIFARALVILLIVGTLTVGVIWMGGERFASRVQEMDTEEPINRMSREATWRSTLEVIRHNPWSGTGFGTFFLAITEFQRGAGTIKLEQAHDDYLDLAANGGVIAIVLGGWFVVMIIRGATARMRSKDRYRRAAAFGATAGLLSLCAHSVVDFGLQITGIAVVCGALVVIAVADVKTGRVREAGAGEDSRRRRRLPGRLEP